MENGIKHGMIIGTGVDIEEVGRIRDALARFGERFMNRVFTPAEIDYCRSKVNANERFAARFAAKEAAMKALGTGARNGVAWRQIEVGHEPGGRPILRLSGRAAEVAAKLGVTRSNLSISHTAGHAIAHVILEK
jgi:holo-[acyl-carrier protein] synthase